MSGVYGNLLVAFPEAFEDIVVWNDKIPKHTIRGIFIPTEGDTLKRQKFGKGTTAVQYFEHDRLFVDEEDLPNITIGDHFYDPIDESEMKVIGRVPYSALGGYCIFEVERVTGNDSYHQEPLKVKEGYFA